MGPLSRSSNVSTTAQGNERNLPKARATHARGASRFVADYRCVAVNTFPYPYIEARIRGQTPGSGSEADQFSDIRYLSGHGARNGGARKLARPETRDPLQ